MDVVTTSLEALIQRATNPQNQKPDLPAIEAFCVVLTKEPEGPQIGSKLLASQIQSPNELEALQALTLLDTCMKRCGTAFHAEIGKFRFLNEMIRLVSPKYLGNRTPASVRQKALQLLYTWTKQYPQEMKIKDAYDMLKKQGVVEEDAVPIIDNSEEIVKPTKAKNTVFEDEENSKLLRKLLQSKNPDDLQAANRLIKTMVKEDERRVQLNSRRIMELESVHNNVKLLSEMLDSYNRNETSTEDLELMKELYQACERLKPTVLRLANETQDNEEMLGDVLAASDELGQVFDKYTSVIVLGQPVKSKTNESNGPSLLDLSSPVDTELGLNTNVNRTSKLQSDMEALGDIFSSLDKSVIGSMSDTNILVPDSSIMQPTSISQATKKNENASVPVKKIDSKAKALEELDELGESLLKQSLSCTMMKTGHPPNESKISANHFAKDQSTSESCSQVTHISTIRPQLDPLSNDTCVNEKSLSIANSGTSSSVPNGDNSLININMSPNKRIEAETCTTKIVNAKTEISKETISMRSVDTLTVHVNKEPEIKPLSDLNVKLEDIKPGAIPPITVIEEKNDISVVLHFAQDSPRSDVSVVVVTTMSTNARPLSNYLFQVVVPKKCKCRLQQPSGTELPAHNPFLPPSAITQIMLIANPQKEPVSLKCMLSYTMNGETFTEMGEVDKLPHV